MLSAPIETVTGRLGVGAIAFLALFLIADGMQIGIYAMVEKYGDSVTFGIVAALPTAVVAYIFGIFCVGFADLLMSLAGVLREPKPEQVYKLSRFGGGLLQQNYGESMRNFELLKGASVAFVLLAIGSFAKTANMHGAQIFVVLAVGGALALSALSLVFAHRTLRKAIAIVNVDFDRAA
jgi:hypothetical protein